MKLTDDVYLVGGGDYGFNLTHRLDCHTYVIDGGDELVMIDAGFGPGAGRHPRRSCAPTGSTRRASRGSSSRTTTPTMRAGARRMERGDRRRAVGAGRGGRPIRAADADQIGLNWAKTFGFYPADYEWEPCEVAHGVRATASASRPGARARGGRRRRGTATATTAAARRAATAAYLFASDLVFWGGAIILQNVPDANLQLYAALDEPAAELEFDALLPGHHMISLSNGRRHVEAAANDFNRIGLPRDLLRVGEEGGMSCPPTPHLPHRPGLPTPSSHRGRCRRSGCSRQPRGARRRDQQLGRLPHHPRHVGMHPRAVQLDVQLRRDARGRVRPRHGRARHRRDGRARARRDGVLRRGHESTWTVHETLRKGFHADSPEPLPF